MLKNFKNCLSKQVIKLTLLHDRRIRRGVLGLGAWHQSIITLCKLADHLSVDLINGSTVGSRLNKAKKKNNLLMT